jgi:hypothetical protein
MYKGQCAECGVTHKHKAFKSRRAGYDVPVATERCLAFAFESQTNNKICHACYLKNQRLKKRDSDRNSENIIGGKRARLGENGAVENVNIDVGEIEVRENVVVTEKEGTAISVLLRLSKL